MLLLYAIEATPQLPPFKVRLSLKELESMSRKAPSSSLSTGFGGRARSHVYILYPPLRCSIPGSRGFYYDDGNKLLLSPTSDQVFSWKIFPFLPNTAPTSDSIIEGPILSIRYSLDIKFLAIQRSNHEIQFINRETGDTFSQRCRPQSESILGFFWTDCPNCDIVLVKTSGLELYSINPMSKLLQLVDTKKINVTWYVYTHESRLILLASGMQCKSFTGFQLSSAGIIFLPKFEMAMAKSGANSKPILAAEDIHIVTVYGRIYCLQVDRVAMLLHLYRFYRDAVVQQGSLPIYSSKISVSVVDNVLLVHQVDAKVVIMYDIFADSRGPISAPLPLLFRGFPRAISSSSLSCLKDLDSSVPNDMCDYEALIYGDHWTFLVPNLICDVQNGMLWRIHLDLEAISASSSDVPSMLEFLQRRKVEANEAKQLCMAILHTAILERRPVSIVARAIDVIVTSYSYSIKTSNYFKGMKTEKPSPSDVSHGSNSETVAEVQSSSLHSQLAGPNDSSPNISDQQKPLTSAAISPEEMYCSVFAPVEEEMAGDPSYLVAIIVEFLRSANLEKVKVHPSLHVLILQLLVRNERFAELGLFVTNKIIEPSKEVALQLLDSGRQKIQTRKLGLDMLRQLSLHHDYVSFLVQEGYYLEALRYARKNKVTGIRASLFLEAALASNESQQVAAVLRFFLDYIPDFRNTPEHRTYGRILNEMNSSVAA